MRPAAQSVLAMHFLRGFYPLPVPSLNVQNVACHRRDAADSRLLDCHLPEPRGYDRRWDRCVSRSAVCSGDVDRLVRARAPGDEDRSDGGTEIRVSATTTSASRECLASEEA